MTPALTRGRSVLMPLLALLFAAAAAAQAAVPDAQRATLGVVVQDVPFERLDQLGVPQGVSVRQVVPGSPAEQAGIEPNDIVIAMDGLPVYSAERLRWLVSKQAPEKTVQLKIQRGAEPNGKLMDVDVTLASASTLPATVPKSSAGESAWLGIQMQPLSGPLRRNFGIPEREGVLIADVEPGSPAESAGLQAGDVLMRIDRRRIHSPRDVYRAINFFDPGDQVELEVIRDAAPRTIVVTLGGKEMAHGLGGPGSRSWLESPESWPEEMQGFLDMWRRSPWHEPEAPEGSTSGSGAAL